MGILGIVVVLLFCNAGQAANKLPVVIETKNSESYLDISKPEALRFIKSAMTELMLIEHLSRKAQSKIQEYSQKNYSQLEWENFIRSFKNSIIYQDSNLKTDNVSKNIKLAVEKMEQSYKNALENHNHYYLKQTLNAHYEYIQTMKSTRDQLLGFKSLYSDVLTTNADLLEAIENSYSPSNKILNQALSNYANLVQTLVYDLKFLKTKLESSFKKHSHFALLEQQNSLSRFHTEKNRKLYLASKAHDQMNEMARIAKTALNMGEKISTKEVISLVESAKKNSMPYYNQIMQVLDFEKILPGNSTIQKLEELLRTQSQLLDNYLLALETNLNNKSTNGKRTENKYHLSFYKQMQKKVMQLSILKCKMVFN